MLEGENELISHKTLKTMRISASNKGNVLDQNTQISDSGVTSTSLGGQTKQAL